MVLPQPAPDRAAVVTGASSGIGNAIAHELARRGHQVVLVARRADRLASLADDLGERAHILPADLSDRGDRAVLLERVTELGLVADVLVNNAGVSTVGPVAASDPAAELNLVDVDVSAVLDLCSRFVPDMVARSRGAVLNVASVAAFAPLPGQAAYGAAKAFVLSYTQSLRAELRNTGVTVAALCPGPVHTELAESAGFAEEEFEKILPKFLWQTSAQVAKAAVDGLADGKGVIVPGAVNKAAAVLLYLAPRALLLPFGARAHPGLRSRADHERFTIP